MTRPFIVAEMSANHLGSLERALKIVDAAADAGADAVKLQTWTRDTMCVDPTYVIDHGEWEGRVLRDLYREAYLPWEFHQPIFERCEQRGIECFSAPFDCESVDFLETLGCQRYKIASFEIGDLPLIKYAASKGKRIIISTGVATALDISRAYATAVLAGCQHITLLQCTSAYPASVSDANLAVMSEFKKTFRDCKVGLSDHTLGIGVAVAAAALGATMIEKHLTLSRADGGPDAAFSMEPDEFNQMVIECNRASRAIGKVVWREPTKLSVLRRSLWVVKDIDSGELITTDNVRTARPAFGIAPIYLDCVLNRRASSPIKAGTPLHWEMLE